MKSFWIRIINIMAIVGILTGYNLVLDRRDRDDQIAKLNAELETVKLSSQNASEDETGEGNDGTYVDGTYQGEADGFGGMISVEVSVENGMIADIEIVSADSEDGAYLANAEGIIPVMIEQQTADVDTVSGATFSSTGIKNATAEALSKAAK